MLLASCKDEEDSVAPVVNVISPLSVPVLTVPDSILVIADVTDNIALESIQVGLVNSDLVHVADPAIYHPGLQNFRIEQYVRMTDKALASGDYFILIYVSDGYNTKAKYLPVTINELPLEIVGYLVVERSSSSTTKVRYLSESFETETEILLPGGFHASGVDPLSRLFYLVTPEASGLMAYPFREIDPDWTVFAAMPRPAYTGVYFDREVAAGTENGDVWVFNEAGQVLVNSKPINDRKVEEVSANGSFMACEMVSLNGNDHYIYTYYRQTGAVSFNRKIAGDIAAILPHGDNFLVFCNTMDGIDIFEMETDAAIMTSMFTMEGESLDGACNGPQGQVFLNTGSSIYLYDIEDFQVMLFSSKSADGMVFDPLNGILYYYLPGGFGRVSYPAGTDLGFYSSSLETVNFHIIYNR